MEAVTLVAPSGYDLEIGKRLASVGEVHTGESYPFVVEHDGSRVYIVLNSYAVDELEPERLRYIRTIIPEPVFYTVDYSDLILCKRVLLALADDSALLIDNDHGTLLSGPAFAQELRSRPGWDWRSEE